MVRINDHGAIELVDKEEGKTFLLNGQRVKHYWGKDEDRQRTSLQSPMSDYELGFSTMLN